MTETYLMTDGSVPADAPRGSLGSGRAAAPWEMGGYLPAGEIRSTPADMARYAAHLLEVGLPEYTWAVEEAGYSWHNGGTYGFSTMLIIDPEEGRAAFAAGDTLTGVEKLTAALVSEKF